MSEPFFFSFFFSTSRPDHIRDYLVITLIKQVIIKLLSRLFGFVAWDLGCQFQFHVHWGIDKILGNSFEVAL